MAAQKPEGYANKLRRKGTKNNEVGEEKSAVSGRDGELESWVSSDLSLCPH